ncbi:hypothetical protein TNCV_1399781 [Trichonephila clavipes]|nr:hypothetical protein TNCV_1399781 [Trichonephila clavipes]
MSLKDTVRTIVRTEHLLPFGFCNNLKRGKPERSSEFANRTYKVSLYINRWLFFLHKTIPEAKRPFRALGEEDQWAPLSTVGSKEWLLDTGKCRLDEPFRAPGPLGPRFIQVPNR